MEEKKIKKWADLDRMGKFYVDILSDYQGPIHIRFLGRQDFEFKSDDIEMGLSFFRKLGEEKFNEYEKEKEIFEKSLKKRGEELSELIYNILQAEGIKYMEEYKNLQKKYL